MGMGHLAQKTVLKNPGDSSALPGPLNDTGLVTGIWFLAWLLGDGAGCEAWR
jgi:hypothetical protein